MEQNKIQLTEGEILDGIITGITNFGAFVKVGGTTTGLVHISEVAQSYVKDINDIFKVDDAVKVKVLKIEENGKIALSIKQAQPGEKRERPVAPPRRKMPENKEDTFEDKLARFMKNSEEIQLDVKRNKDLTRKKKKKC